MMTNAVDIFLFIVILLSKLTFSEPSSQAVNNFESFYEAKILPISNDSKIIFTTSITDKFNHYTDKKFKKRQVYIPESDFIKFNDLLDQRVRGNTVPQCPCVIKPGSDKCIAYDSRYQAASIEEALITFRDVSLDEDIFDSPATGVFNADAFTCQSLECQTCSSILLDRLRENGLVAVDAELSIPYLENSQPENCRRLRFTRPRSIPNPPPAPDHVKKLINEGWRQYGGSPDPGAMIQEGGDVIFPTPGNQFSENPGSAVMSPPPVPPPLPPTPPLEEPIAPVNPAAADFFDQPQQPDWTTRQRRYDNTQYTFPQSWIPAYNAKVREISDVFGDSGKKSSLLSNTVNKKQMKRKADPPVIGTRYLISCVQRGEVDDSDMLTLCSSCWTWRKLPSDYFPPLINELVCAQGTNGGCLSGWGQCQQKYRNFDVLRKVDGIWQPTTIATATCCDCRVRAGTEMHALVVSKT